MQNINPVFVKLPSGLVLNLAQVTRAVPGEGDLLTVHLAGGDAATLGSEDAAVLRKQMRWSSNESSNARTAVFWLMILLAIGITWMAIHKPPLS